MRDERQPDVSVIVPNYNARQYLADCLESVFAQRSRFSFEVLVVDDGSRDGSAEMVRQRFPQATLFVNPGNLGYARSCNLAIEASRGRYIHLLNNDMLLPPDTLDGLASYLEAHPEVGAAGCALLNPDGSLQAAAKALPSVKSALFGGRSWLSRWFPRNPLTRTELLHWKVEDGEPFRAGYVSGASMMLPREELTRVGMLDDHLFYFNDADYCKRLWDAGREVVCLPHVRATHHDHAGGSMVDLKNRFRSLHVFHVGAYRYYRKHSGNSAWHPYSWIVVGALAARFALSGTLQLGRECIALASAGTRAGRSAPPRRVGE